MKRTLVVVTAILAALGIGFAVEHLIDRDHYNPGFDEHPTITRLHVTLGGLYLGLAMPSQHTVQTPGHLYDDKYLKAHIEYDIEKANQLLDEMGLQCPKISGLRSLR